MWYIFRGQVKYQKDNYCIVIDKSYPIDKAAIYFSENGIFFPNTKEAFTESIILKNKYTFFNTRIIGCGTHIFLRDIHKASYSFGINKKVSTIEKVADLLRGLTMGCRDIITIGISSGGFASVALGLMIKANKCIAINPLYSLASIYSAVPPHEYPKLFSLLNTGLNFDIRSLSVENSKILNIFSGKSDIDRQNYEKYGDLPYKFIEIVTNEHGVIFDHLTICQLGVKFDNMYGAKLDRCTIEDFLRIIHGRMIAIHKVKVALSKTKALLCDNK